MMKRLRGRGEGRWMGGSKYYSHRLLTPPPSPPNEQEVIYLGNGSAGGARHSGAPMLRRYAATSAL